MLHNKVWVQNDTKNKIVCLLSELYLIYQKTKTYYAQIIKVNKIRNFEQYLRTWSSKVFWKNIKPTYNM